MTRLHARSRGIIIPGGGGSSPSFDASIGNGVDSYGYADLPLRSGAKYIWVGTGGSDSNDGLTHATRKLTGLAAQNLVTPNAGDQVLFGEGGSYTYTGGYGDHSGHSALHPTSWRSYDMNDPTNYNKYGRATRANKPIITSDLSTPISLTNPTQRLAFQGLKFNPGNSPGHSFFLYNAGEDILLEHCELAYTSVAITRDNVVIKPTHLVTRANLIYGGYSLVAAQSSGGLYVDGFDSWTNEYNIVYHPGWRIDPLIDRTMDWSVGGPTQFRHCVYQQEPTNALHRYNLMVEGAADGGTCRGDHQYLHNLVINCPTAIGLGAGTGYDVGRPSGVSSLCAYNAVLGTSTVPDSGANGRGITSANGKSGLSDIHHNLIARSDTHGASAFITIAQYNQPSYADFHDNVAYDWSGDGYAFLDGTNGGGGAFPLQTHATHTNNIWENATDGNGNLKYDHATAVARMTNKRTKAQFYNDTMGGSTLDDYMNYCMDNHHAFPWIAHKQLLMAGYGITY